MRLDPELLFLSQSTSLVADVTYYSAGSSDPRRFQPTHAHTNICIPESWTLRFKALSNSLNSLIIRIMYSRQQVFRGKNRNVGIFLDTVIVTNN